MSELRGLAHMIVRLECGTTAPFELKRNTKSNTHLFNHLRISCYLLGS